MQNSKSTLIPNPVFPYHVIASTKLLRVQRAGGVDEMLIARLRPRFGLAMRCAPGRPTPGPAAPALPPGPASPARRPPP